jgi:hypothetical protein
MYIYILLYIFYHLHIYTGTKEGSKVLFPDPCMARPHQKKHISSHQRISTGNLVSVTGMS